MSDKNNEIVDDQEIDVMESAAPRIAAGDVDVTADMAAIFEGTDLTEDFKTKATDIFQAALVSKINEEVAKIEATNEAATEAKHAELTEALNDQLNEYLDYVVEQWMEDNKLAVEAGIKTQMTEEFLKGLKTLFSEHYVDIPEDKVDVVEELTAKVVALETSVNEEITKNIELKKQIGAFEREVAFVEVAEGLTETQAAKLESLAEAIEYSDADGFKAKLKTLRENYFPETKLSTSTTVALDDEPIADDDHVEKHVDPAMKNYVSAISRSLKK